MLSRELSRIKGHISYHGEMGKRDAAAKLKEHPSGTCYLTRYYWGDYMLSVKEEGKEEVKHFKISKSEDDENHYTFSLKSAEEEKEFTSVPKLLEYYKDRPINSDTASIGDYLEPQISYAHAAPRVHNDSKFLGAELEPFTSCIDDVMWKFMLANQCTS